MNHVWTMSLILADVVWPALLVEQRLLGVLPIAVGLIAEWLALYFGGFGLSWKKAVIVDLVMNTVSSVVGIVLIPILGLIWEFVPGLVIQRMLHVGTFNPLTWIGTFLFSVGASTVIEAAVVRWLFRIPLGRRRFWILCAANCASTAIAFASLWIHPPEM